MSEQEKPLPHPVQSKEENVSSDVELVEEGDENLGNNLMHARREIYAGPLPHPAHFAEFERTLPGAADRILTMVEEEGRHRRSMEKASLWQEFVLRLCGLIFGFLLALVVISAGAFLIFQGRDIVGLTMVVGAGVSLVGLFVLRQRYQQQLQQKRDKEESEQEKIHPKMPENR